MDLNLNSLKYEQLRHEVSLPKKPIELKCTFKNTVRRVVVNYAMSYDQLVVFVTRLFKPSLDRSFQSLVLKYKDEDGDLVSIVDDIDINHALINTSLLKLHIFDSEQSQEDSDSLTIQISELKSYIESLTTKLNKVSLKLNQFIDGAKSSTDSEPKVWSSNYPNVLSVQEIEKLTLQSNSKLEESNKVSKDTAVSSPYVSSTYDSGISQLQPNQNNSQQVPYHNQSLQQHQQSLHQQPPQQHQQQPPQQQPYQQPAPYRPTTMPSYPPQPTTSQPSYLGRTNSQYSNPNPNVYPPPNQNSVYPPPPPSQFSNYPPPRH